MGGGGGQLTADNRPLLSPPGPLYQNEAKYSAFDIEIIYIIMPVKTHFHEKGCALGLVLKVRIFGTRKLPVNGQNFN